MKTSGCCGRINLQVTLAAATLPKNKTTDRNPEMDPAVPVGADRNAVLGV